MLVLYYSRSTRRDAKEPLYLLISHAVIASVWRPPQATAFVHQRPDLSSVSSMVSSLEACPLPILIALKCCSFDCGKCTGTSSGCPVVNDSPKPNRPWSPLPNCKQPSSIKSKGNNVFIHDDSLLHCDRCNMTGSKIWPSLLHVSMCKLGQAHIRTKNALTAEHMGEVWSSTHRKHSSIICQSYWMCSTTGNLQARQLKAFLSIWVKMLWDDLMVTLTGFPDEKFDAIIHV